MTGNAKDHPSPTSGLSASQVHKRLTQVTVERRAVITQNHPEVPDAIRALAIDLGLIHRGNLRQIAENLTSGKPVTEKSGDAVFTNRQLAKAVLFFGRINPDWDQEELLSQLASLALREKPGPQPIWRQFVSYPFLIIVLAALFAIFIVPIYLDLYLGFGLQTPAVGMLAVISQASVWLTILVAFQGILFLVQRLGMGRRLRDDRDECSELSALLSIGLPRDEAILWSSAGYLRPFWQRLLSAVFTPFSKPTTSATPNAHSRHDKTEPTSIWQKDIRELFSWQKLHEKNRPVIQRTRAFESITAPPSLRFIRCLTARYALANQPNDRTAAADLLAISDAFDLGLLRPSEGGFSGVVNQLAFVMAIAVVAFFVTSLSLPLTTLITNLS